MLTLQAWYVELYLVSLIWLHTSVFYMQDTYYVNMQHDHVHMRLILSNNCFVLLPPADELNYG